MAAFQAEPRGTDRFAIQRKLGQGGFGAVFQAYDRQRRMQVALKMLHRPGARALAHLKREFRALAEISHPNLVSLYELLFEEGHWCITMELIEGVNFLQYVRQGDSMPLPRLDLERLRGGLPQLADGLAFLHAQGKLHRDIKTTNVLATGEHRVVLLDFGLATDLGERAHDTVHIGGTVSYMSPEQSLNRPVTAASDWYGVGVMLFEVLTGRLPFSGEWYEVLRAKQEQEAPQPRDLMMDVPDDLNQICCQLLDRDPAKRLAGVDALAKLKLTAAPMSYMSALPVSGESLFVGRRHHLSVLRAAFDASKEGRAITMYVHGSSGIGKTALVRRFLQELPHTHPEIVVLSGQCYERESVPYKALDSLVDALSRYLRRLPEAEVESLLPRDIVTLALMFPALREVRPIADARQRIGPVPESLESRRRAFSAFRELLARLSDRRPLVLFIDDLQWGDLDSSKLLASILEGPDPPAILLIICYRSEEASNVYLRELLPTHKVLTATGEARELVVDALSPEEAAQLAQTLVGAGSIDQVITPEAVLRECRGNPLFIHELVRHALLPTPPESLTLDRVLRARIGALPTDARRLLELLAVSGGPLDAEVAAAASRVESRAIGLVAALRSARLIRVRRIDEHELLETYHDRIRDAVLRVLEPHELRTHHAELARALERFAHADPEMLAVHLRESGDAQGAAGYALQAAQLAMEALAFDRASRLYRLVLDLRLGDDAQRGRIFERLGEALANAGRGHGAAQAYLEAAHISSGGERLELQRRAAEQLLRSGHVDQGLRVMGEVLEATGLKLASTPQRALLSLLWGRSMLRLSRLRFCERPTSLLASRERLQIDACWSVAMHIGTVDHFRAADFQARHLRLVLRSGDPYRIARALAMEVAYSSIRGPKTAERTRRISQSVDQLAARVNDPQIYGLVYLSEGIAAYMQGYWKLALKHCRQAEAMLRERRSGIAWELDTAHLYALLSLFYLGELHEFRRQVPAVLKEAQERDDLTAQTNMRVRLAYLTFLLSDDIAAARHEVVEGIRPWSRQGFHAQHYFEMHAHAEIALYANQPESAWEQITLAWPRLRASLLLRVHPIFIEAHDLRARAAIAMAQVSDGRTRVTLLQQAQRDAARLARAGASWGRASAFALKAGVANMRGDGAAAADHLVAAERLYQAADMALHAAMTRWQRGTLSIQGRPLAAEENGWPKGGGVQRPDRIAALLVPGFADRVSPA